MLVSESMCGDTVSGFWFGPLGTFQIQCGMPVVHLMGFRVCVPTERMRDKVSQQYRYTFLEHIRQKVERCADATGTLGSPK